MRFYLEDSWIWPSYSSNHIAVICDIPSLWHQSHHCDTVQPVISDWLNPNHFGNFCVLYAMYNFASYPRVQLVDKIIFTCVAEYGILYHKLLINCFTNIICYIIVIYTERCLKLGNQINFFSMILDTLYWRWMWPRYLSHHCCILCSLISLNLNRYDIIFWDEIYFKVKLGYNMEYI